MSNTAEFAAPSLAPEFVMRGGSKPAISPAFRSTSVPPGWMSLFAAVDDVLTTLPMPLAGALLIASPEVGVDDRFTVDLVVVPPEALAAVVVDDVAELADAVVSDVAAGASVVVEPASA